ncbi:amino acid ABC transporter permease [Albidovulum sp.]|uniref:amino acid ABC transporter permease n=1 Tax=Albidovulum sp. TaxID=1872424 RepID=UPI0039B83E25
MTATLGLWLDWLPRLLGGLWLGCKVAGLALGFGIPMGLVLALAVQAKSAALRAATLVLVEIARGTPALVLLQLAYYGLPSAGVTLSTMAASVAALAVCTAAYTSEIIRGGLEAVAAGQKEAADALGMGRMDKLRYIVLPQGLAVALPPLLGFSITILQGTSLCFAISLPELISQAYAIGASTFLYLPALALASLLYAAICIPASLLVGVLERRLGAHHRA